MEVIVLVLLFCFLSILNMLAHTTRCSQRTFHICNNHSRIEFDVCFERGDTMWIINLYARLKKKRSKMT